MLCFRGLCHHFLSKIFCLTVPKNFVVEPFSVSLISAIEKFYASEGYVTIFCRKFLSHSAEKFRSGTFQCVPNFGYRKNFCFRGLCHVFLSKLFCLTLPKNFVGELFSVSLISGIEKFYASDGYVTIFCRKFFVPQCRKFRRGTF